MSVGVARATRCGSHDASDPALLAGGAYSRDEGSMDFCPRLW